MSLEGDVGGTGLPMQPFFVAPAEGCSSVLETAIVTKPLPTVIIVLKHKCCILGLQGSGGPKLG